MKIQKIFSDMYDQERLYSVLMNEDEMYLYQSLFSDEEGEPKKGLSRAAKIGIGTGLGTGVAAGGVVGAKYLGKHLEGKNKKALEEFIAKAPTRKETVSDFTKGLSDFGKKGENYKKLQKPYDKSKQILKDAQEWVKKNPKKAAGIVLGTAAVGAASVYGAKKLRKNRDEE